MAAAISDALTIRVTKSAHRAIAALIIEGFIKVVFGLGDTKFGINLFEMLAEAGSPIKGALAAIFIGVVSMHLLAHAYKYTNFVFNNGPPKKGYKEVNDYQLSFITGTLALIIAKAMTAKNPVGTEGASVLVGMVVVAISTIYWLGSSSLTDLYNLRVNLGARVLVMIPSGLIQNNRYDMAIAVIVIAMVFVGVHGGLQEDVADEEVHGYKDVTCKGEPIRKDFDGRMVNGLGYWTSGLVGSWILGYFDPKTPALTWEVPHVVYFTILYVCVFAYCTKFKVKPILSMLSGFATSQASSIANNCLKGKYSGITAEFGGLDLLAVFVLFYIVVTFAGLKLKKGRAVGGYKRRKWYGWYLTK